VRTPTGATAIGALLRNAVTGIDSDLPLYRIQSMEAALTESQWNGRLSAVILDGIVLLAICLAGIGVYAVTSYAVTQRTQELAIRVALGAPREHVVVIVLRRAAAQLGVGLLAGVGCTVAWEEFIGGGLASGGYHISDPANLAAVSAILTAIVALACVVPARRAARLDPIVALRHD
jgi:putative ABC transport system permease protein